MAVDTLDSDELARQQATEAGSPDITDIAVEVAMDTEVPLADRAQLLRESAAEHARLAERQQVMARFFDLVENSLLTSEVITDDGTVRAAHYYPDASVVFGEISFDGTNTQAYRGNHIARHIRDNVYSFVYPEPGNPLGDDGEWTGAVPGELSALGSFRYAHDRINDPVEFDFDHLRHVEEVTLSSGNSHIVFDLLDTEGPKVFFLTDEPLSDADVQEIGYLLWENHPDSQNPDHSETAA